MNFDILNKHQRNNKNSLIINNDNASLLLNNQSAFSTKNLNENSNFMNPPSQPNSPKLNANNSSKYYFLSKKAIFKNFIKYSFQKFLRAFFCL